MTEIEGLNTIGRHVRGGQGLSLFLDYDGTLVPIGRSPSEARPDAALLALLTDLAHTPAIQTTILSGRPLSSIMALLPIPQLTLAGIYGLEVQVGGQRLTRGAQLNQVRPIIAQVKSEWERRVGGRRGFLIEDKGLAVALHARGAEPTEAVHVVREARSAVADWLPATRMLIIGADDYLEVAPAGADKAQAVGWFLDQPHPPDQLPVYFGDDENDDEAFAVVKRRGGIPVGVGSRHVFRHALESVSSPEVVREWLQRILIETR